jgi:hypothetical protein
MRTLSEVAIRVPAVFDAIRSDVAPPSHRLVDAFTQP